MFLERIENTFDELGRAFVLWLRLVYTSLVFVS